MRVLLIGLISKQVDKRNLRLRDLLHIERKRRATEVSVAHKLCLGCNRNLSTDMYVGP